MLFGCAAVEMTVHVSPLHEAPLDRVWEHAQGVQSPLIQHLLQSGYVDAPNALDYTLHPPPIHSDFLLTNIKL
jgi:hypothetical protein